MFQYLEHEVIVDVARRIGKTMTYTRTAELQAMSMHRLGYSPARIRSEAMKILNADPQYRKAVAKNTLEYKKDVRDLINDITKQAMLAGDELIAGAGNMAWVNDLAIWKAANKTLEDNSYLQQLIDAYASQTEQSMKNLTKTTGFKAKSGFESIENLYRREMDKATIKVCSGTFTREQATRDAVKELAQSGLRSVDYASGYSMQIDTAARMAIRTGCHQISQKIEAENIMRSGEALVYIPEHEGARNKGTGHANHEQWQGKVYSWKPGNYEKEEKRIGQKIEDLWEKTGYSLDGSKENDPLGLNGYNCRHNVHIWFEGVKDLPAHMQPMPLVTYNGKTLDYYAQTQKMRQMERGIRALKREKEACKKLGIDTTETDAKISAKRREYNEFCDLCGIRPHTERLRYDCNTSELRNTRTYEKFVTASRENAVYADEIVSAQSKLGKLEQKEIIKRGKDLDLPVFDNGNLGKAYRKWNIQKESGYYDVVGHGSPEIMEFFGRKVNDDIIAKIIKGRSDYKGEKIRLLSCMTGLADEKGNCFAQRLANALNVEVQAPNKLLYLHKNGTIHVGSSAYKNDGEMITFYPRKGHKNERDNQ